MADDLVGQLGIYLLHEIQGDPITDETAEKDQHGEAHQEDEQEDEEAQ